MDDLINVFVKSNFTEEQQEDIFQAFGIFRVFNYNDPFPIIESLLMMESYQETSSMVDTFTGIILNAQDYLLDQHGIVLTEETTMAFNNTVLRVLFQLQRLEDPEPVLRVIENSENSEVKFATICALYTDIPETSFLQVLEDLRPVFLKNLAAFLYTQEDGLKVATQEIPKIVERVKLFKEVYGINQVVRAILDVGTVMGETFEMMIPLFNEFREIVHDEKILVESLFFMLLMSSDGVENPLEVFQKHADTLIGDLATADRLGKTIGEMNNALMRQKELAHEVK